uniref:DNA repair protein complementing XP-C cells n=1 Tax=Lygus hesperus TaxID=30085 RepID=A0A146KWV6_LYGHE
MGGDGDDDDDDDEEPTQDVEFTIALPSVHLKRKKYREMRDQIELARKYNESRRLFQVELHKASLLGYLSHGFFLNSLANTDELHALALSVIPNKSFYPPSVNTLSYSEKVTKWFNKKYPIDYSKTVVSLEILVEDFGRDKASSLTSLVVMFVALCRQLGLKCRLLIALQPCPIKPPASEMMKIPKENEEADGDDTSLESPKKKAKAEVTSCENVSNNESTSKPHPNNSKAKRSTSPNKKKTSAPVKTTKQESASKVQKNKSKKTMKGKNSAGNSSKNMSNRRVLSSDDSGEDEPVNNQSTRKGVDFWAEVYIEAEEMWVPADVARGQVNNATAIGNGVTGPLAYVVAWNSDATIKDLTRRYSPNWLTAAPKLRVEPKWWKKTLAPWAPRNTKLEKLENKKLDEEEAATPIPTKIQDCKNHPFYALKRHLLKYEAIYPPDAKPIGFIRGEAVYSRVCVSELHTKETWMRQGKALRVDEEPYKIVKARPKWDKVSSSVVKDLPLPLFGYWQVEDYIAPPAVDGIVPKNEYGNVEMYRPSMLPAGTVHLQVPGLAKVARKLGIDFAPAVVGWEYHGGSSHPSIDGIIVCKEQQDTLLDAWNAAVDNDIEKEKSKSHLRAVKNWKKLIRSVIIRRRIEKKYKLNLSNVNVK